MGVAAHPGEDERPDRGRTTVTLPDGSHAVECEPVAPIDVWESHETAVVTVPAELARVTVGTARNAVQEYVTTGQRPTGLTRVGGRAAGR